MSDVFLKHVNSAYIQVIADPSTLQELSDDFTFYAENYKYSPAYKNRVWDGKIRLLSSMNGLVYAGLASAVKKKAEARGYSVDFDDEMYYDNISRNEVEEFVDSLNIPEKYKRRDYQTESILKCLRSRRRLLLSPTSSGKSFMIYTITRWYNRKTLIIVPTIGLVRQMASDFTDYGYTGTIHMSTDKLSKDDDIDADVVITTWQSLNNGKSKMHRSWYEQFEVVFGDEAHHAKAKSMIDILTSLKDCKYRFGTTGTIHDDLLVSHTIQGLFGPIYRGVSTKELMNDGYVSTLGIKCIVLKHNIDWSKKTYPEEIDYLCNNEKRNKFIANLALSLEGNRVVFFKKIDHGKLLYDIISSKHDHNVFYIDGSVSGVEREEIRKAIENESNAIIIGSLGVLSTGVNIPKLHHMISAAPMKSKIKVLQSIGRILRLHNEKSHAILYDIGDNITGHNYTYDHFVERLRLYNIEKFDYKIYKVGL